MLELIFSDVRGKQAIDIITQKANKKIKIKMIIFYITQFIMIIILYVLFVLFLLCLSFNTICMVHLCTSQSSNWIFNMFIAFNY